jgi:hypothetical protein
VDINETDKILFHATDSDFKDPTELKQDIKDGLRYWTPNGVGAKAGYLSPSEKAYLLRHDIELRKKAQWRAETCCFMNCNRPPADWIVEIKFDLLHKDADTDREAVIDTGALKAELPGFCGIHKDKLPGLVQQIYYTQPETWFGFKPTRWIAKFIDGSSVVGDVDQILLPIKHEVTDTLIHEGTESN